MLHLVPQGIGHLKHPFLSRVHLAHLRGVERNGAAVGIGAHQPSGAQQHAAKIAGNHHGAIHHAARLHHLNDGHAGGTAGFAVIAVAHDTRVLADDIGIAVVRGILVPGTDTVEKGKCFLDRFHRRRIPDEAAFVDHYFIMGFLKQRFVGFHHALSISRQ